jgi:hypothetical protein
MRPVVLEIDSPVGSRLALNVSFAPVGVLVFSWRLTL